MDYWINSRLHDLYYFDENYKQAKPIFPVLNTPLISIKKIKPVIKGISYRQINWWENQNLITGTRANVEKAWRKFSLVDVVVLQMISDLRNFGVSLKTIEQFVEKTSKASFYQEAYKPQQPVKKEHIRVHLLEYMFIRATNGEKIIALFNRDGDCLLEEETKALLHYSGIWGAMTPTLILPFFEYVRRLVDLTGVKLPIKDSSTLQDLLLKLKDIPSEQERQVLAVIKNRTYQEISIRKNDKEEITIKAKRSINKELSDDEILALLNSKAYQKITVLTQAGKRIGAVQEESLKA